MQTFAYTTERGEPRIGVMVQHKPFDFTRIWQIYKDIHNSPKTPDYHFIQIMIETGNFNAEALNEVVHEVQEFRGLTDLAIQGNINYAVPIQRPQNILCLGRNYKKHAEEMNNKPPDEPILFAKCPSALLPHQGAIRIAKDIGRVDHEIELAIVIGKETIRVSQQNAMQHVAGFSIANDVSARDLQAEYKKRGLPWTLCKGMDTFLPMGPYLVPADAIDNPQNLTLKCKVNSEMRQTSSTAEMIFDIPYIISYISKYITLQAGNIICTGTPEGVSRLNPGDTVQCSIDGLGVLSNRVMEG
ncbi:MAG: fumarylacetoacetate hydrolase family protein [candidate division KSB1 bacterium]|nr:fumarylacetoacetate hydrolase family protein [candidate division KSB1 bacterium]